MQTFETSAETTPVTEIFVPSSTSDSVQTSATTEKTTVQSENAVKSNIDITPDSANLNPSSTVQNSVNMVE